MEKAISVLLIDDHPLFRSALKPVIRELAETTTIIEAGSITEALSSIEKYGRFELVILDLNLPDAQGLKTLLPICQMLTETPVIVISANENPNLIYQALGSCAKGYIPKSASKSEIKNALVRVLEGNVYIPSIALDGMSRTGLLEIIDGSSLTRRQEEVLQLLSKGLSNKQIGNSLGIAETTVRVHVSDVIQLLHANNRTDAVIRAQQLGLVELGHS